MSARNYCPSRGVDNSAPLHTFQEVITLWKKLTFHGLTVQLLVETEQPSLLETLWNNCATDKVPKDGVGGVFGCQSIVSGIFDDCFTDFSCSKASSQVGRPDAMVQLGRSDSGRLDSKLEAFLAASTERENKINIIWLN